MTEEQVDLLLTDQPVVNYKHSKDKGKKGKRGEMKAPSKRKVLDAQRKWEEKYTNGEKPKLDLGGFKIGGVGKL